MCAAITTREDQLGRVHTRLTAAVLAVALPFAMTGVASAAPFYRPSTPRPAATKPAAVDIAGARLGAAAIPGAVALPLSGFSDTVAGTPDTAEYMSADVFSFNLNDGQVLKATITPTAADRFLVSGGFTWDAEVAAPEYGIAYANGTGALGFDIYIPAEYGFNTYYLGVFNPDTAACGYTVTYEILSGRSGVQAERKAGTDRYAVAEAVGLEAFPGWAGVTDVVIASGDDRAMADPLAAAGLAGAYEAPLLLVRPTLSSGKLPAQTERAITNIKAANGGRVNIHVIGGTTTVPAAVYNRISALKGTGTIERISGTDRYQLSAVMARKTRSVIVGKGGEVGAVFIANGENPGVFYDALAASTISYRNGVPMVLSRAKSTPTSVKSLLASADFAGTGRYLVNSSAYLNSTVKSETGARFNIVGYYPGQPYDRYEAAWDIADFAYINGLLDRDAVAVANKLPDALTGGVAMGQIGAPILYSNTAVDGLPAATWWFLYWNKGSITNAYVLGGTSSISDYGLEDVDFALEWPY